MLGRGGQENDGKGGMDRLHWQHGRDVIAGCVGAFRMTACIPKAGKKEGGTASMKDRFNMYAQRVNGAVHVSLSGPLDVSKALDVLCFLDLYVNRGQGIVMDTSNLSPDNSRGLEMLRKGLQRLEDLGHPILDHQFEALILPDKQA
jgi:hypothetical protein